MNDTLDTEKTATDKSELAKVIERLYGPAISLAYVPLCAVFGVASGHVIHNQRYTDLALVLASTACFISSFMSYMILKIQEQTRVKRWVLNLVGFQLLIVTWNLFWFVLVL